MQINILFLLLIIVAAVACNKSDSIEQKMQSFNQCESNVDCKVLMGVEGSSCYYFANDNNVSEAITILKNSGAKKVSECSELDLASGAICIQGKCMFGDGPLPKKVEW